MDQASDSQQATGNHPSADWTSQLVKWPCSDTSTKALKKLACVRELTLRHRRVDLNFKPKKNQEAALGQICGELALAACRRCVNDKGPFVECVVVRGSFAKSCCNCHYSSQGLSCSFRGIESVPILSTPNGLNATSRILDEQAKPAQMANYQPGPSAVLAGPQVSQSDNNSVSTRLRSKKDDLRKRPNFSANFAFPRTVVGVTTNEPLTRKRQWQETTTTGPALEQWPPERGTDAVDQQSEETVLCLREEIQRLRREKSDQQARQLALIKGFVSSAAVVEIAVDVREAELRCGLRNMSGTPEEMQEQAQQMIDFSKATSWHVSRFVNDMLEEQRVFLYDDQQKAMRLEYDKAEPSQAVTAIIDEELSFMTRHS
ncbi:hypothetical protein HO173_009920 [Letharia columbiana]|uniref:Uncharacterized protein n=1 Tax=Letharia columbiana TaxID=112416 RepID=A0A8H6FNK0_9LECA|nr:uncharacterized protein HO173_009920 [Letharia columbiana]KAF6231837.1 hypothetical protein HO173_009920 [Letharia columbiana]